MGCILLMYEITLEDEKKLAELGPYQQAILRVLAEVPKGKVVTYGDLAKEVSRRDSRWSPTAFQAVGTTMKNNPCGPFIPCHRVVNKKGYLALNFGQGGWQEQRKRLKAEGLRFVSKKRVFLLY